MANGRVVPFLGEEITHPGNVNLLDDQTVIAERGVTDPWKSVRGPAVTGVPSVIPMNKSGRRIRIWDQIFFGIIHVIPRTKNLGPIVSQTTFQAEVWNADDVAHLATGKTIVGSSGVAVTGGVALPAEWAPFSSVFFNIVVDGQGDPIVDTLVTWLFPGFTGTDCHVIGVRVVILPIGPRGEDGIFKENYGYLDDVIQGHDLSEQRILHNGVPIREITLSAVAHSPREAAETMVRLFNGGQFLFAVPYWPDLTKLTSAIIAGATTIPCDTTTRTFAVGDLFAIWRDNRTWEVLTVAGVSPTGLTVGAPGAVSAWPAGSLVVPLLQARPLSPASWSRPSTDVAILEASFTTEPT